MPQREKWALAFDAGGLRYSVMTTNSSESLNKVFKVIYEVHVSGIVSTLSGSAMNTLSIDGT
jgi:hypothetical protein